VPVMTTLTRIALTWLASITLLFAIHDRCDAQSPTTDSAASINIAMEDCKASRPGSVANVSVWSLLLGGSSKEDLVKRGTLEVDGQKCTLFLPKAKSYSTKNTKPSDSDFDNTSTLISVEQVGEAQKKVMDGWFANLPIRLGDKMFDVMEIAADGSRIVLRPSKSPLRGVVVGRGCPTFAFKTPDGQVISRESLNGKAFLLDIWSTT